MRKQKTLQSKTKKGNHICDEKPKQGKTAQFIIETKKNTLQTYHEKIGSWNPR